jgi:hypothetical protein
MYRLNQTDSRQLTVRFIPWMQQAIGLIFVLAGWAILVFVFPNYVHLHCDRRHDLCSLEQSNLLRTDTSTWPLQELKGAQLEVVNPWNNSMSFRIRILLRKGSMAFTPYSIGGSWEKKQATVARINAFAANAMQNTLNETQDERRIFYPLAAGLILFGLLPIVFVRTATCRLDLLHNEFLLANSGLWGRKTVERRLSDLVETVLDAQTQGGARMCRVVFRFRSGEKVPLTYYRYHDCKKANEISQTINAFLNKR